MLMPFDALFACTFKDNLAVANWSGGTPNINVLGGTVADNKLKGYGSVLMNGNE